MTLYNVLKFFHILAAVAFAGGVFSRQAVRAYAARGDDVGRYAALSQAASHVENLLVKPGSILILLLGVALAWRGGLPMLGSLQGEPQNWLLLSNVLYVTTFALVPLVFIPRGRKHRPILERALAEGRMTPELRASMRDPIVRLAHLYEMTSLVLVTALMVLKPF